MIHFREQPRVWEQGLPVASGNLGAVLYGIHGDHRVMLSHKKHWLPLINCELPDLTPCRAEMLRLCREKRFEEAERYWFQCREKAGLKGFWWHDPLHPAAELRIVENVGVAFETRHVLDCSTGEARIEWCSSEHASQVQPKHCIRLRALSDPETVVYRWITPLGKQLGGEVSLNTLPIGHARLMGGQPVRDFLTMSESVDGSDLLVTGIYITGHRFQVRARVCLDGKVVTPAAGTCLFCHATELVVLVAVSDPEAGPPEKQDLAGQLTRVSAILDERLRYEEQRFSSVYNRVTVHLGSTEAERQLPTDTLLEQVRSDRTRFTPALAEKMFAVGRYLIWSASQPGALPSHLQGAWNGWYNPPWMCGYTQDENVQLHYWQVLAGNMPEAAEPYFAYVARQLPHWRENARKIHGMPGVLATINASRTGLQFHAGPNWPWDWYTAAAGWLAQFHWDYYLYTRDRCFLRDNVLPLLKEIVAFYEAYATRDDQGKWACVPSISPENIPAGRKVRLCGTTAMDVAVAREVYTNLLHACTELGIWEPEQADWQRTLASMPAYKMNADGAVKEWMDEDVLDEYHHRHQSHLYPVFPGYEINPDQHADLMPAFAMAVQKRLVVGLEAQVGWSLSHMAGIFARLGDGERAYECLQELASRFLERNLFSYCCPGYIAMQLDGILGGAAAIQEMLLQSYPLGDEFAIRLLPALPRAWPDGSFTGLRVRGGAIVSASWHDGIVTTVTVTESVQPTDYRVDVNGRRYDIRLDPGETWGI